MNQDSEQNDRKGKSRPAGPRETGPGHDRPRREQPERDDNSQRRYGRSVERRDDVRNQDTDRPRFNRDTNRSTFNRSNDAERPRFKRDDNDNATSGFRREREPRPDSRNDERRSTDRPRFNRENDRRPDRNEGSVRPTRSGDNAGDRPRFNRDDKPRFDRNRNDESRNERPRFSRDENREGKPSRSFGSDSTSRFDRTERRERPDTRRQDGEGSRFSNDRNNDRPERSRPGRSAEERPRFTRDERPRDEKPSGPPRFSRNESSRGDDRSSRPRSTDSSGSPRNRNDRTDNAPVKRVGGFNRDADERNKEQYGNNRRRTDSRNDSSNRDSRFSSQQRKESGDRRTGDYDKAPNYNLEQTRFNDVSKRNQPERPRPNRSDESERRQPSDPNTTRLNRYIANSGVCSRREADELIARGDISVNGKVVTEMGYKVKDGDTVKYGTKVLNPERFVYLLLNKPKDFITTTDDPEERRTVMELVADAGNFRMYPVGRLDRNTTGLLLLTNDGELADKLTHPSNNVRKIYQIELDKPITEEHFEALKKGIELEDGPIKPDAISIVTPDAFVVGIEIHSGRNRIVRRMFEKFGYEVTKLDRTTYAGLTKKELPRGKWRFLDPKEVVKLKYLNS